MKESELQGQLAFIKLAENLKNTCRFAFTSTGKRESSAEHSWRVCLLVALFARSFPELDIVKCFTMAVIHDLAEALCGDTPAIELEKHEAKDTLELESMACMLRLLAVPLRQEFMDLWQEYNAGSTPEARYVKALDKIETLIQHNQGGNPPDFNYAFNITYGTDCTDAIPLFARLRALIDQETRRHAAQSGHAGETPPA